MQKNFIFQGNLFEIPIMNIFSGNFSTEKTVREFSKIEFTITDDEIHEIYKMSYNLAESRGKKRQTLMNDTVINGLQRLDTYSNCRFVQEDRLDSLWGKSKKFNVDIGIYSGNSLFEIVLLKAPASNVLQNHVNFLNSVNSDIDRLGLYKDTSKVKIINFTPNKTPFFENSGRIRHLEINEIEFITKSGKQFMMDIDEIYVTFDIVGIENCINKIDVNDLFMNTLPIQNVEINLNSYKKPIIFNEQEEK